MHFDILWAVQLLLDHGADLTKRHIDWPYLTLYEYCIEFSKIDIKVMIDKYIQSLIRKSNHAMISKLIKNGWKINRTKKRHRHNCNPNKKLMNIESLERSKAKCRDQYEIFIPTDENLCNCLNT